MIAKKELGGFFSSLGAYIFFGAFLAASLFIFFWIDPFFARNIADVRPIFEWMPLSLIFLVPALTMRMWSEEIRAGTLELLMTSPVSNWELVLGKFVACLLLVVLALALTLPLPISVALVAGNLDWGPVFTGYIAAIFLAGAYIAVGLYVSAQTENQVVSWIASCAVSLLFLLVGADALTGFFNVNTAEVLRLVGLGSRFESISRGVVDLRDIYYYVSFAGAFLFLNVLTIERRHWGSKTGSIRHKRLVIMTWLCMANVLAANFWLQQLPLPRIDFSDGHLYSISSSTRNYLHRLQEPLLIRAYLSRRTHPWLMPLVPRLRDFLKEYALAGKGKVRVEFVDPMQNPQLEKEAYQKYGIRPVPFQIANKYQNAVSSCYFDVLVKYGDQFEKLGIADLVQLKITLDRRAHVDLKNPEYSVTSAIKKVVYSYQSAGDPFAALSKDVQLTAYISNDSTLPASLIPYRHVVETAVESLKQQSKGKLSVSFIDPQSGGGQVEKQLESDYGYRPGVNPSDKRPFWFQLIMSSENQVVNIPIPAQSDSQALERNLVLGLRKFARGYLKRIGLWLPASPTLGSGGEARGRGLKDFTTLTNILSRNYALRKVDLQGGVAPDDLDLLLIIAPERFDQQSVLAVDQFLMKGGTVMIASNPYNVVVDDSIKAREVSSGLEDWLKHNGIAVQHKMVLDEQNFALPIPVRRTVSGMPITEMQLLPYPYFVDVRRDGMSGGQEITSGLDQVNMTWCSPISLDESAGSKHRIIKLLESSPRSWESDSVKISPNYERGNLGFEVGKSLGRKLLAVEVEGRFTSFFKGRKVQENLIDQSPDSARIFVFASRCFLSDKLQLLASQALGAEYTKPAELILNAVDWSLQDRELLGLRGRAQYARTLRPLHASGRIMFEYGNYGLALLGLLLVWLIRRVAIAREKKRYKLLLADVMDGTAKVTS
jgi:ABC-2 type transport system permease protein